MWWPTLQGMLEAVPSVASLVLVVKLVLAWGKLPDEVASHFGPSGEPNSWMSREGFGAVTIAACVVMALLYSPALGRGFEKVSLTFLLGQDMAMLVVVVAFWQAINFNVSGKRVNQLLIFSPLIILAVVLLFRQHLPGW